MDLTDKQIRKNIKYILTKCRKEKKLTQEQLADYLESKPTTIASWEQGRSLPNIQTLYKLAQYYGKTIAYMYGDEPAGPDLRADERELLNDYNNLNAHGQEKVRGYVSDLAGNVQYKKDTTGVKAKTG